MDKPCRLIACLLTTVLILSAVPFIWGRPAAAAVAAAATAVPEATPAVIATPAPSDTADVPQPSATPAPTPAPVADTLTDGQKYVDTLVAGDSTNLLVCAPDPSAWNMDTILIASISPSSGQVSLISLPRDIFISYSASLRATVDSVSPGLLDQPGMLKINAAHAIGDKLKYKEGIGRFDRPYIEFLADLIEEIFAIRIDDYVYLQTKGFRRIVDYFGGITVNVPVRMLYADPTQDLVIDLQPGSQHLDGAQAEGFVRFRQGYDDNGVFTNYGDLYRKENQSRFFKAFIQQHLTLRNLARLSDISDFLGSNVITSIKGWDRIVAIGALAEKSVAQHFPIVALPLKLKEVSIHGLSYVRLEEAAVETEPPSFSYPGTFGGVVGP